MIKITADDNDTIIKTRNTSKLFCLVNAEAKTLHYNNEKFYCNLKKT